MRRGTSPPPVNVQLREVTDADLPTLFAQQRDPEANRMAAFPPRDADAFREHWAKVRADPTCLVKVIVADGELAGNIGSFTSEGKRLVGYWIGRAFWGRGIASAALAAFLDEVRERPLHAFVAVQNAGSARVLEKCGFVRVAERMDGDVLEREYVLR